MTIVLGTYLAIASVMDFVKKKLSLLFLILGAPVAVICIILNESTDIRSGLLGAASGLVILLVSFLSGERIGRADGIIFCITGLALGAVLNIALIAFSFFLGALFALGWLIIRRVDRNARFPFIPFIFAGYIVLILSGNV